MNYVIEELSKSIKEARKKKGLSQRDLSSKIGVPQSHISKIENGRVDLQTSSLIEIARALDLEVMLVSRTLILAVHAMQASSSKTEQVPAYRLEEEEEDTMGIERINLG